MAGQQCAVRQPLVIVMMTRLRARPPVDRGVYSGMLSYLSQPRTDRLYVPKQLPGFFPSKHRFAFGRAVLSLCLMSMAAELAGQVGIDLMDG